MLNLYDDSYERAEYTCCSCERKDYLLKEAGAELGKAMEGVAELRKVEEALLGNLENVCHMIGIPFRW